mgnify:CR=1 FL=1
MLGPSCCLRPGACKRAHLPAPKGMPACPRKHAMALAACLGLGSMHASMPWPSLPAHGGCPGLRCCMPIGGCLGLPSPWMHALALAFAACLGHGLGCVPWPHIWSDFLKMRVFWKMRLFPHEQAGSGHPRGMPACTPCRIAPHRPALRQNWLVPFPLFVFLNSVHDFRGRFQQAVRHSEQF